MDSNDELHLQELKNLAESAGYEVVGSLEQTRKADPSYQIGKGKVNELVDLVKQLNGNKIIFDNDLKPIQAYNIAKITGIETIDRFQLILEIFVKRASTKESQLQVQLAGLRYQLPKVRESIRLARMGEQPGFLGLGRYEIDVYLEEIKRRITHTRSELRTIHKKRELHRIQRIENGFSLISLAGYTYAGKTTLFNKLAATSKAVDQGLFTTLSTTTRAVHFQERKVLLSDTVGFVDRLPLVLVEAFRSTLEETVLSNVILLVLDFHESINEIHRKLICCIDTLNQIGAYGIPIVTALNKIDLLTEKEISEKLASLHTMIQNPVQISAVQGQNLDELKHAVISCLDDYLQASFVLPFSSEALSYVSNLYRQANVFDTRYVGKEMIVTLRTVPWFLDKIRGQLAKLGGHILINREKIFV